MTRLLALLFFIVTGFHAMAQERCGMQEYQMRQISTDISLQQKLDEIELFTKQRISGVSENAGNSYRLPEVIKVPVVVHVLYHTPAQNVSTEAIQLLIAALNRDFNKRNSDTVNIPSVFKPLASSMGFEFKLATMDPKGMGTTGIVRKYTPVTYWMSDDKMKFNASYGDNAWDSKSYLNIWICNMIDVLGYSTFPGMDPKKDGVVLSFESVTIPFGTSQAVNDHRTGVHEVGHWMNLRHIWGEVYCGDDKVDDTPKQSAYTPGCPSGTRISCSNSLPGDMYMNYMDFTDDVCMNMFTNGQRQRARVLFEPGGARNSILYSKGLNHSSTHPADIPDYHPQWLFVKVYPNPATTELKLFFEYDDRWEGKEVQVLDITGRIVIRKIISSRIESIDISHLNAGTYFIKARKDEIRLQAKFVKL